MSFDASWLALRAPADDAARDAAMLGAATGWARARPACRILDIGSGTGATRRAFADLVPGAQWWLCDNDPALLALADAPDTQPLVLDLANELDRAFAVAPQLVTASAFFDLAGMAWIDAFVARLADAGAALYAALTFDGRQDWAPPHPEDEAVFAGFARDMARDKGLGPALGGDATACLVSSLERRGYALSTASSPWVLLRGRDDCLINALASGTGAAGGASPQWLSARREASRAVIGHLDLWAMPRG